MSMDMESYVNDLADVLDTLTPEELRTLLPSLPPVTESIKSSSKQVQKVVAELPYIQETELVALGEKDNACPICMVPYLSLIAEEEMARAVDSPAHPVEELGVTRLVGDGRCGHAFCRKDLSKWILNGKNTCPLCRQAVFKPDADSSSADAFAAWEGVEAAFDTIFQARVNAIRQQLASVDAIVSGRIAELRASGQLPPAPADDAAADTDAPAPAQAPAPAPASGTNPTSSGSADTSAAPRPATGTRRSGGIGNDLGEGHAPDDDDAGENDAELLAGLSAGISPQQIQRLLARMDSIFPDASQTRRDDDDDDRNQFSGMYS